MAVGLQASAVSALEGPPHDHHAATRTGTPVGGTTTWSVFPEQGDQFAPIAAPLMVTDGVDDLHALVNALRSAGCQGLETIDESEYGKSGGVIDPKGNNVELWEPPLGG